MLNNDTNIYTIDIYIITTIYVFVLKELRSYDFKTMVLRQYTKKIIIKKQSTIYNLVCIISLYDKIRQNENQQITIPNMCKPEFINGTKKSSIKKENFLIWALK